MANWNRGTSVACASLVIVLGLGCGANSQVRLVDNGSEARGTSDDEAIAPHQHHDDTMELPADEALVEPDHPAVQTPQERAIVHIHTPAGVCSGSVIGKRLVLTAHQCVGKAGGPVAPGERDHWRVEIASSTLTWTARRVSYVALPDCDWKRLDMAVLVLDQPVDWVEPLKMAPAPGEGGAVQALGFGKCPGETRPFSGRTGEVVAHERNALVIDIPLCRGDVGGPIIGQATGQIVGVISHQDDDDGAPRHTTTVFRFDTRAGRKLLADAEAMQGTPETAWSNALACP